MTGHPSTLAGPVDPSAGPVQLVIDVLGEAIESADPWENESGPGGATNTSRGLTHSLDCGEEGLAMQATQRDIDRFWAKVDRRGPDECWRFTAALDKDGYGTFWINGATRRAPRIAWMIAHPDQSIAPGIDVRHSCDNPPCVNPAHLDLGTAAHNAADRVVRDRTAKGDRNGARLYPERLARGPAHPNYRHGGCKYGHAADRWHTLPSGERICRDCSAAKARRQRAKAKEAPDYAERRAKISEGQRRRYAARTARKASE